MKEPLIGKRIDLHFSRLGKNGKSDAKKKRYDKIFLQIRTFGLM